MGAIVPGDSITRMTTPGCPLTAVNTPQAHQQFCAGWLAVDIEP
jgi:hypothetical protein